MTGAHCSNRQYYRDRSQSETREADNDPFIEGSHASLDKGQ